MTTEKRLANLKWSITKRLTHAPFVFIFILAFFAGAGLMPKTVHGDIFVVNYGSGVIGEYTTSGVTVKASLISLDTYDPSAMALSDSYLYVANYYSGTIGKYTTSGNTVDSALISGFGRFALTGIAVSGSNLFISSLNNDTGVGAISEYTTSGELVNSALVSGLLRPKSVIVSGSDMYVACDNDTGHVSGTIGKYTLGVTPGTITSSNPTFLSGLDNPQGIAVSGSNLFVVQDGINTVGEYTTSGATVNASLISNLNNPIGIAVFGSDLYVTNFYGNNSIGKYTLGDTPGTIAASIPSLVTGLRNAHGIVLTPEPASLTLLALGAAGLLIPRRRR